MSAGRGPADPSAKNIWCDAKDHARPRKYLEQNIFSKRGVQVELNRRRKPSRHRSRRKGWSSSTSTEHHSAKRCVSPAITEPGRKRLEPTAGKALSNRSAVSCKGTVAAPTRKAAR